MLHPTDYDLALNYFLEADTGLAALIPGTQGAMDIARFRLTAGLADPRKN